jgi:hypothetical protein
MKSIFCIKASFLVAMFTCITLFPSQLVMAQSKSANFTFNKHINELWVGRAVIVYDPSVKWYPETPKNDCGRDGGSCLAVMPPPPEPRYGQTKLYLPVHTATCPNQNHIKHTIVAHFQGTGGGWFKREATVEGSDQENKDIDLQFTANGYYGEPKLGNLNLTVTSQCIYHGVNNRGGPRWWPGNW